MSSFRPANIVAHTTTFNSAASCEFLNMYNSIIDREILAANNEPKHQSFAPSSFRCERLSWFKLRGVQPDQVKEPDRQLNFTAIVGTACHEAIQSRLEKELGAKWISVEDHLKELNPSYKYTIEKHGHEWRISIAYPPVRFACDGIIEFKGKRYLLEIKTSEYSSFQDLTGPKAKHVDQIKCYATLLGLPDVLVLYVDRQYGQLKCFELHISTADMQGISDKMQRILKAVETNIAPDRLPTGSSDCAPSMCPYYKKCKQWG